MFSTGVYIGVVRLALAAVFLFSGLAKLVSPQPAAAFVADVLSLSSDTSLVLILILSVVELAIGLSLAKGYRLQLVSFIASMFLLGAFAVGLRYIGEEKSCGCFGELISSETDGVFLVRSLGFLALSLVLLKYSSKQKPQQEEGTR
jgi:uncharacterized membrane protein YphA (DoxX/SURF4 family)